MRCVGCFGVRPDDDVGLHHHEHHGSQHDAVDGDDRRHDHGNHHDDRHGGDHNDHTSCADVFDEDRRQLIPRPPLSAASAGNGVRRSFFARTADPLRF
jgi:hypothetical protein